MGIRKYTGIVILLAIISTVSFPAAHLQLVQGRKNRPSRNQVFLRKS